MKLYEVRVESVSMDGRHLGYFTLGYTVNKDKAHEVATDWAKEHEVNQWYLSYGQNDAGHMNVEVVDRGELLE